jgi:hypothetical protein
MVGAALGCAGLGGEPPADLSARNTYDQHGVRFEYPGNWRLAEEVTTGEGVEARLLTIETPGDAVVLIHDIRPPSAMTLAEFSSTYQQGMRDQLQGVTGGLLELTDLGSEPLTRSLLGQEVAGVRERYTIFVLGKSIPHTLDLYPANGGEHTVVVVTQVADEDRRQVELGFDLILDTLAVE